MEHVSTDKNKNMIQNICNKNEGVSYTRCAFFFSLTIKIGSFFKLRYFEDFFDLCVSHFCTHLFYIEGNSKESKVHEDLILSKMAETFVVHIVFHLFEHSFRFYASLSSVFQSFLGTQQLFGFLPVSSESVILLYRPVPLCLKISAS